TLGNLIHADAAVAHSQSHTWPGPCRDTALGVSPIQLDAGSLHRDYAASWHRIACVHRQVDNDLFQLTGVGPDGSQLGCQYRAEVDVLADKSTEHRLRVRDDRIQVEHARIEHLLPAEDEERAREPGRSVSGP